MSLFPSRRMRLFEEELRVHAIPTFPVTGQRAATKVKKETRHCYEQSTLSEGLLWEVAAPKSFTGLK